MNVGQVVTATLSRSEVQQALVGAAIAKLGRPSGNARFDASIKVEDDGSVEIRLKYAGALLAGPVSHGEKLIVAA